MKPTQWIEKFQDDLRKMNSPFMAGNFKESCLIHSKGGYGIFLLEDYNGKRYTVKVTYFGDNLEIPVGLYVKQFASSIPNLLHVEGVYKGGNPLGYPLFTKNVLNDTGCKKEDLVSIFTERQRTDKYFYYLTKACSYNLGYYFGTMKGTLTFNAFVGFSFSLLVGLQTLHRLGVWHRDLGTRNVLMCKSDIANKYSNIRYTYNDGTNNKTWTLSYKDLENRDMKLIDYGEASVMDDITDHCLKFKNEVSVSLVLLLDTMWRRVIDKTDEREKQYADLKSRLKACTTTILDPMLNSEIYDSISNISSNNTYDVELLPFLMS